jgi:copper(I)-binding protein
MRSSLTSGVLTAALVLMTPAPVGAHEYKLGSLVIDHPWARATPAGAKVAGGYMTIINKGTVPDRLIGGSMTHAGKFELHEMRMEGDVMRMRPLPDGLEIKPGQSITLAPGGYHVMFTGLKGSLKQGEKIKGRLVFEKAGSLDVEYVVESIGARDSGGSPPHGGDHGH